MIACIDVLFDPGNFMLVVNGRVVGAISVSQALQLAANGASFSQRAATALLSASVEQYGNLTSEGAPQENASTASAAPGPRPPWADDPKVVAAAKKLWDDSNPNAPPVHNGDPGSQKKEQGMWITKSWLSGKYSTERTGPGTRDEETAMPGTRPISLFCLCDVAGWVHSHPNTTAEGYDPFVASQHDLDFTRDYAKAPGLIKTPGPDEYIPYP